MSPVRHLISCCSLVYGLLNLTIWSVPLLGIILIRALAPGVQPRLRRPLDGIYRAAVTCNDLWFRHVLGYRWQPPDVGLQPDRSYLVISNHQSWADSFLLQTAIVHRGPILKVLVKEELTRWPILGLIFSAYDFPRLKRRASNPMDEPERRRQDTDRIRQACAALKETPGAMLIYPEGTRFTAAKQAAAGGLEKTGLERLLPPKPGGFATVLESLRGHAHAVVDVAICYPESTRFWQFLSGGMQEPQLRMEAVPLDDIADPVAWLKERWEKKDRWLAGRGHCTATP